MKNSNFITDWLCTESTSVNCIEDLNIMLLVILIFFSVLYIIVGFALFFGGRRDLREGESIEDRKEGLVMMLTSPVWIVVCVILLLSASYFWVVDIFKDVKKLHVDIVEEKEAEKIRTLEKAMLELESMKREEHDDWIRKFNSIETKESR